MAEPIQHSLITPQLLEWSVFAPSIKAELFSHALVSDGKVVLIDPTLPDDRTLTAIRQLGDIDAILITSANHERDAHRIAQQLHVPVGAPAFAVKEFSFKPDIIVDGLRQIYGIVPLSLPGAAPGEHAYYSPYNQILILGDAILNLPGGPVLLPDKYCTDSAQLKSSLTQLLRLDIAILAFAHGPALHQPATQLNTLLNQ